MIKDIPTSSDFYHAGTNLLNVAWDMTVNILLTRVYPSSIYYGHGTEVPNTDWVLEQPTLTTALSLVQQAVEFFLKGCITEVSPYLLISGRPESWPKGSASIDTSFAEFRSLDAQDLVRVYNTVRSDRLAESFIQWNDDLRRRRNKLMHTVGPTTTIDDKDVFLAILQASAYFNGAQRWIRMRRQYLNGVPYTAAIEPLNVDLMALAETPYSLGQLQREIAEAIEHLEPHVAQEFFGFNKAKPRWTCLRCLSVRGQDEFFEKKNEEDLYLATAQLIEELVPSMYVRCIICEGNYQVSNVRCRSCGGTLADAENGLCLTCTSWLDGGVLLQQPKYNNQ